MFNTYILYAQYMPRYNQYCAYILCIYMKYFFEYILQYIYTGYFPTYSQVVSNIYIIYAQDMYNRRLNHAQNIP